MDRTILRHLILSSVLVASRGYVLPEVTTAPRNSPSAPAMVKQAILGSGEASKLLPLSIFWAGNSCSLNRAIRSSFGFLMGCTFTQARETLEACFISEVFLYIHGRKLGPGVSGLRVDDRHRFIILDIAARSILTADSVRDLRLFHPDYCRFSPVHQPATIVCIWGANMLSSPARIDQQIEPRGMG
jgi:hypothetical protein